jgi:MoxR-like ATPase
MDFLTILNSIDRVVKGKKQIAEYILGTLLAKGHVLLEDVPGVGKTLLALAIAKATGLEFKRIQFTSDTLPSDILGSFIFDVKKNDFVFKPGPIFTNVLLADEINRASPKTQSALLEAMAEGQVTVEGQTFKLPEPFFVIATQNPLEEWGTFPLPTSQLDRFMIKTSVGYPPPEIEKDILAGENPYTKLNLIKPYLNKEAIILIQKNVEKIPLTEQGINFVEEILLRTRNHPDIHLGVSTRGGLQWVKFSKAISLIRKLDFVTLEILKETAMLTLPHRLVLKESSLKEPQEVIKEIIQEVEEDKKILKEEV